MSKRRIFSYGLVISLGLIYLASGFYALQSGQRALILRFGKVADDIADPGIHYHLPTPIERVLKVHVSEVQTLSLQGGMELQAERMTGDENLIVVRALVSYDIKNVRDFLFQTQSIPALIQAVSQSCLSQKLASMPVDDVMTGGKSVLRLVMKQEIQHNLDDLHAGVRVISVELTDIVPPEDVYDSFKAVSDAREQKQRIIQEAQGYANEVIPAARGKADAIMAEAESYATEVTDFVNGRMKALLDVFVEYQRNPAIVTRLKFLETLREIAKKSRVMIDTDPENNIYYIPQNPQ
jgi:membrane protease subunit HflK